MIWYSKVDFTAGHLLFSLFILKHYELKCKKNCIIVESLKMKTHSDYNFFSSFRSLYNTIFWWSMLNFEREQSIMHYIVGVGAYYELHIFCSDSMKLQNSWFFFFQKTSFKEGWAKKAEIYHKSKDICFPKKVGINFLVFSATWK